MGTKKKTAKEIDTEIQTRRKARKKILSLQGEDNLSIERSTYFDDKVCDEPVRIVRLREPKYEEAGIEIINNIPFTGAKMVDNGFKDAEGYLWMRIKADAPRHLIHHFIDKNIEIFKSYPLPPEDPRRKARSRADNLLEALEEGEKIFLEVKAGKTLLQIAKERCGISEAPALNATVDAEYKKVRKFYKKVMEIKKEDL